MTDKQTKKQTAAGLLGLADPLIRQLAQKIATGVSADSIIRTTAFESAVGALKGWLEGHAEKYSPWISALVEKATDLEDFLTVALAESRGQGNGVAKATDSFLAEASARLRSAADPAQEFERIKIELEFRAKLAEILKAQTGRGEQVKSEINRAAFWLDQQALSLVPTVNLLNQHLERVRGGLDKKKRGRTTK